MFVIRTIIRFMSIGSLLVFGAFIFMMFTPVTKSNVGWKVAGFCHASKISMGFVSIPNIPPEVFGKLNCNCLSRNLVLKSGAERTAKSSEAMRRIMVGGLVAYVPMLLPYFDIGDQSKIIQDLSGFPEKLKQARASCLQAVN